MYFAPSHSEHLSAFSLLSYLQLSFLHCLYLVFIKVVEGLGNKQIHLAT